MEAEGGAVARETEIAIYAKIGDPHGLEECTRKEHQIQLEGKYSNGVLARVRKTTANGQSSCVFTFKTKEGSQAGVDVRSEYNAPVSDEFFEGYKKVAEHAVVKTRYVFESTKVSLTLVKDQVRREIIIPSILYEVDVFEKADGSTCEYCKIDVELDRILNYIDSKHPEVKGFKLVVKISHLPFKPFAAILPGDEHRELLDHIWQSIRQPL